MAIFLIGCEGFNVDYEKLGEQAIVCNEPYIRIGASCCLDKDSNSICDKDEGEEIEVELEQPKKECQIVDKEFSTKCEGGKIYYYNNCNEREGVKTDCTYGCEKDKVCKTKEESLESPSEEEEETESTTTEEIEYTRYTDDNLFSGAACSDGKIIATLTNVFDQDLYVSDIKVLFRGLVIKDLGCYTSVLRPGSMVVCDTLNGEFALAIGTNELIVQIGDEEEIIKVYCNSNPISYGGKLADYPAPFVTGCEFDGGIVVGDNAPSSDMMAAVDISTTLAVSGTGTEIANGGGSSGTEVCKVSIPSALLASEVRSVSAQNLISVGNPCDNDVTAEIMGMSNSEPDCLAGFEEGKAMIKAYEGSTGKVALVVAGYSAMDTRMAARVLKEYEDYYLRGSEVEIVGTSLTDITVIGPTPE